MALFFSDLNPAVYIVKMTKTFYENKKIVMINIEKNH